MSSQQEIYASFEIRDFFLNFIVVYYDKFKEYNVLFERNIEGEYSKKGIITNPKDLAKQIKKIINDANAQLSLDISKVGLVIPNSNLNIIKNVQTERFKNTKKVDKTDILNLISSTKKMYIPSEQIILSIKPYAYISDNLEKTKQFIPPLGKSMDSLTMKTLVYTIDKDVYKSHLNVLKISKLKLLQITTKTQSLAFSTGLSNMKKLIIIVDWNDTSIDISIFARERLSEFKSYNDLGINNFINDLQKLFKCTFSKVKKYVFNVLNNDVLDKTKNFYIYKSFDEDSRNIKVTMKQLIDEFNKYFNNSIETINNFIMSKFKNETKDKINQIFFTGDILRINCFEKKFEEKGFFKGRIYKSNIIGVQDYWSIPIIGNIFYQHLVNKLDKNNNNLITSV